MITMQAGVRLDKDYEIVATYFFLTGSMAAAAIHTFKYLLGSMAQVIKVTKQSLKLFILRLC